MEVYPVSNLEMRLLRNLPNATTYMELSIEVFFILDDERLYAATSVL